MTIKQQEAIKRIVENHGNISKSMIEAGYDPTTAKNPKNLTESKGFQELKEQYKSSLLAQGIDGKRLAKKMDEWLEAQKPFSSHTEPDKMVPDYQTQIKAGEMLREDIGLSKDTNIIQQFNAGEMEIEFIGGKK